MDKINIQNGRSYRTAGLITGLLIMLIMGFWNIFYSFYLYPIFSLSLFMYEYKETNKFNIVFFLFLLSTNITEILFLFDYDTYVVIASLFSVISSICLLLLLKPVLKKRSKVFSQHYILELIIGFLGFGFVLGYLIYSIAPVVPDLSIFIISTIIFIITIGAYFITPSYNKHTGNISLFAIGGAYMGEMVFAFIYKYIYQEIGFLLVGGIFTIYLKVVLATYLTKIDAISDFDGSGTNV
ncbi:MULTISPECIES: hypothetical protein [unclassified Dokdonia]|uniref:hypothetical protein n=1 Tax=unclassified Dokdonia TaxID=2615033 RepID=UPI00059C0B67|nr:MULTISPECIES: hypothetical protein [unclassified Dokdonia]